MVCDSAIADCLFHVFVAAKIFDRRLQRTLTCDMSASSVTSPCPWPLADAMSRGPARPPALYRTASGKMTLVPHNHDAKSVVGRYTSVFAVKQCQVPDTEAAAVDEAAAGPIGSEGHAHLRLLTGNRGGSFKIGDKADFNRSVANHRDARIGRVGGDVETASRGNR